MVMTVDDVTGWYEGNEIKLPELAYAMVEFDGNWYYEAECLNVVDFDNIDTEKADITGADTDEPVLTIYAKASEKQFLEGEGKPKKIRSSLKPRQTLPNLPNL